MKNVVRVPIIISCGHIEKWLQVPTLESGTRRERASAVCTAIQERDLQHNIHDLVFDLATVSTDRISGTCTIMENREILCLKKKLNTNDCLKADASTELKV